MLPTAAPLPAATAAAPPAVQLAGLCKRFGAVQANDEVSLQVERGSVHGIVGENGAGKSTLMSLLYGLHQPDRGSIAIDGRPVRIRNPHEAIALGIGMVQQHFLLVDTLSGLDNLMLGAEPDALLRRAEAVMRPRLYNLMQATGLKVDLDTPVGELPLGERQRLEILKALLRGARLLILDEPTAVLAPAETDALFEVLARLAASGTTVLLITHKLKEVMRLCQRVSVMRAGRVVHEADVAETTAAALASAMIGRKPALGGVAATRPARGELRLEAAGLQLRDALGTPRVQGLSLRLQAGEIVGIAGVSGNGQSELLELLSGLRAPDAGTLRIGAARFHAGRWLDPQQARRLGVAHVPEDRQARALVLDFAAWESALLGYEGAPPVGPRGWIDPAVLRAAAGRLMQRFDVRPPDPQLRCAHFSGGNQQKLVLARELGRAPQVLLVGQPTRGVDIGAVEFIHAQLRALRDAGCAVLLVSSELDEILALADRVLVMHAGRFVAERAMARTSEAELGLLMSAGVAA